MSRLNEKIILQTDSIVRDRILAASVEVRVVSFRFQICIVIGLMATVIGCGEPNAKFVTSDRTKGLIKEARRGAKVEVNGEDIKLKGVEDYVVENFGTPHDLVAWLRLPVDFGGQAGTVATQENEGRLKVDIKDGSDTGNATLVWLTGDSAGQTITINGYNAAVGEIALAETAEVAAGTQFVISPGQTLADGRRHYMTHCSHCHGTAGDGAGPTAEYLYPKPRDYRKGIFKFTRTKAPEKITTPDLKRIVKQGIPGTYMPSFMLLADDELHAIVEYVRFLAIRGEYENKLCVELEESYSTAAVKDRTSNDGGESKDDIITELTGFLAEDLPGIADDTGTLLAETWERANSEESLIVPSIARTPDSAESRSRGRALFLSAKAKCANCHGPNGLGNGPQTEDYEKDPVTNQFKPLPGLYDEWGQIVKPRNLTSGIYRGGRRPIDLFSRIHAGIKGAKMPAFGGSVLKDEEIWDIVNYVLNIPHEVQTGKVVAAALPKDDKAAAPKAVPEKAAASTEGAGE